MVRNNFQQILQPPHTHSPPPPPHKPPAPSRPANSSLCFYPLSPLHSPCRFPRAPPSSSSRATSSRTSARSSAASPTAPPCGQTSLPKRGLFLPTTTPSPACAASDHRHRQTVLCIPLDGPRHVKRCCFSVMN